VFALPEVDEVDERNPVVTIIEQIEILIKILHQF